MSATDSPSWGTEALSRGTPERRVVHSRRQRSLLGARTAAVIIDGFVLLIPVFGFAWILSVVFPHRGFFFTRSGAFVASTGSTTKHYKLALPGWLVVSALSLSYFFVCEAVRGQTIGKRAMGLHVRDASGGPAGLNAISARTVLRLIDALPFLYLIGALVALVSGSRRRRIGDWIGGTVVVHDVDVADAPPARSALRVAVYPVGWVLAVLFAVFALGLGKAAGEGEAAVALVQRYVKAREQGQAGIACSMLTYEQQRELTAIQTNDYANAAAGGCPAYILRSDPSSHLLNPGLPEMAAGALTTRYTSLGAVVVDSQDPPMELIAIPEAGQLKLDMRGVERLGFLKECSTAGSLSGSACGCTFAWMRVQEMVPEPDITPAILRAITQDSTRCRSNPAALPY